MAKFSGASAQPPRTGARVSTKSPVKATTQALTHQGGLGYSRDAKSDLFLLAVTNMVGEDTFYEASSDRDERFRDLIKQVTLEDPDWIASFVPYLRNEMNMRSASVVMAVESARVRLDNRNERAVREAKTTVRQLIDSAITRADEPAEVLGYWIARYGRTIPAGVKRGIADAVKRVYNEYAAMKYDGNSRSVRMGDVLSLVHPEPTADWQSALFHWILDERGGNTTPKEILERLPKVSKRQQLDTIPVKDRKSWLKSPEAADELAAAGITWEDLSGWINGPLDKDFWEAVIPSMGYMALLRNLRNFDQTNVSLKTAKTVAAKLSDPEQVGRSRQFPYRFLSAYKEVESERWKQALEEALDASTANLPTLPGKSLILIDTSGSMAGTLSARSHITRMEVGILLGIALAKKNSLDSVRVVGFASGTFEFELTPGRSVLAEIAAFTKLEGKVGHGTDIDRALRTWNGEDRVFLFTDMQTGYGVRNRGGVPESVPIYGFNLGGYAPTAIESGTNNNYEIGGFSDKVFQMITMIEKGKDAGWPWETKAA